MLQVLVQVLVHHMCAQFYILDSCNRFLTERKVGKIQGVIWVISVSNNFAFLLILFIGSIAIVTISWRLSSRSTVFGIRMETSEHSSKILSRAMFFSWTFICMNCYLYVCKGEFSMIYMASLIKKNKIRKELWHANNCRWMEANTSKLRRLCVFSASFPWFNNSARCWACFNGHKNIFECIVGFHYWHCECS